MTAAGRKKPSPKAALEQEVTARIERLMKNPAPLSKEWGVIIEGLKRLRADFGTDEIGVTVGTVGRCYFGVPSDADHLFVRVSMAA